MSEKTYPGKHPLLKESHFTEEEKEIINALSKEFYITSGGEVIKLGFNSEYKYIILSPTEIYKDMFNIGREIIVVLSSYNSVQARTLDVFEFVAKKYSSLRVEKICNILISADNNVEKSLNELIKNDPESQVIIPFSYSEIIEKREDNYFYRNRFKSYFYTRDLFAFEAPLKKDIYFFGRNDLIQVLINRFKSGENSGLFGLRKTGKTSLINGIERNLLREEIQAVIIDCQDPSFNQRRWNEAIYYMCLKAKEVVGEVFPSFSKDEFTEKDTSLVLENILEKLYTVKKSPLYLIFDEIENISVGTSPAEHWRVGVDFALFWQSLRSIFQRKRHLVSYLVVGTNPTCIELRKIGDVDNPIFNHFEPIYIPGFEYKDTREMTRKLGRRMGLKFEEGVYSKLTDDFGGHPFLMRHVCSLMSKMTGDLNRPVNIGKPAYSAAKDKFLLDNSNYMDMIISVLKDFYSEEYEMLVMLANGDNDTFNEFANMHKSYTAHLIGYGLIKRDHMGYDFNIESVRAYVLDQSKYKKIGLNQAEMWAEISERRNAVEVKLRKNIRLILQANLGEINAKNNVLDIFGSPRKEKLNKLKFSEIFDPKISEIYFSDLSKIVTKNWDLFKNILSESKQDTFKSLELINASRTDAHAKDMSEEEFYMFRICITKIENDLNGI